MSKLSKITMNFILTLAIVCTSFMQVFSAPPEATTKQWVEQSNKYTQLLLDVMASFNPETAARYGIEGIDEQILDVKENFIQRELEADRKVRQKLEAALQNETDERVKQDLQILITAIDDSEQSTLLQEKYFLPYYNISQLFYYSIQSLLDDQVAPQRHPAALIRLKKYAGLVDGYEPVATLLQNHISEKLQNENLMGPFKQQVDRDLENTPRYFSGIKELFEKYNIDGYQQALTRLTTQTADYESFIKEKVLPRAKEDFRLPTEVYQDRLKNYGVDMAVEELIRRARVNFISIQNEMNSIGKMIADERGWRTTNYRDVLQNLKKEQILGEKIIDIYKERVRKLEELATANKVVSIPDRDLRIRLATEAESAAVPAPHMRPPRLIGNTGEMGEFVLPLNFPGKDLKIDDFTYDAMTWTLAVHEGRPGHEMQFATLVESGISMARAIFAFNSVNVEGWALYMEAEMKPYIPLKGQMGTLKALLLRAARAFLDPGLQNGSITREEAERVLREDVCLSEAMTLQELQRYTFRAPGQATSYFVGYQRLLELRVDTELHLGAQFDRQAFNDFILAQGLIPPDLQRSAIESEFIPRHQAATNK